MSAIFEVSGIAGIEPPYTAVPAIIERMDDRRNLPDRRISLRNKSPQALRESATTDRSKLSMLWQRFSIKLRVIGNFVAYDPSDMPIRHHVYTSFSHIANIPPGSGRTRALVLGSIPDNVE